MPATDIKRLNFYEGQYLGAQDLAAAQEYQRQQDQRHRLAAHTWGIAVGLQLDERPKAGGGLGADVFIKPGYAVDGFGRAIVLLEAYKITEALFAQFTFDPALPDGRWIPVWLRYREQTTTPPRPGFAVCDVEDQAYRILETFQVVVGELPSITQQRDPISVAGKMEDAADENLPDTSIPYQALPETREASRWMIRLGSVRWLAPNPPATTTGHLVISQSAEEKQKARDARPYIGVIAENVLAAAGKIRIKDRLKVTIAANETGHLAAIEGSLRVDEDLHIRGKLGIGVLDPEQDLSVNAGLNVDQANANDGKLGPGILFGSKSGEGISSKRTNGGNEAGLDFYTAASARLSITKDGKVGIGTPNPNRLLTIQGAAGTYLNVKSENGLHEVLLGADGSGGIVSTMTNHDLQLRAGENSTKVVIRANGNVGLGVLAPEATLQVAGDLAIQSIPSSGPRNLPAGATMIWNDGTWLRLNQNLDFGKPIFGVHTPGLFASRSLNIGGGGNWGEPGAGNVWITGRVGIGTTSPALTLDVKGDLGRDDGPATLHVFGSRIGDIGGGILFLRSGGGIVTFDGNDNVGIGTASPVAKLDVAGEVNATNIFVISDERFKTNVKPLSTVLEKLDKIRGVSFEGSETHKALGIPAGRREIGVIAQELETVFPELVVARGPNQYRAVDYGRLAVVVLEAVKELKAELRAGKAPEHSGRFVILLEALKELKTEIDEVKVKLQALEKKKQRPSNKKARKPKPRR